MTTDAHDRRDDREGTNRRDPDQHKRDQHKRDQHEHDRHDLDADPVTDRVHDNSWSANLENPEHAEDRNLVVEQALSAVDHTAPGNHVNLVTHGEHGHPETYLYEALADAYGDDVEWEYVDQCGCGGHVVRVRT